MNRKKAFLLSVAFLLAMTSGALVIFTVFASQDATINATVTIAVCGNGVKETREQCDGSDFDVNSCTTYSFSGGSLACQPSCELNTSSCTTLAEDAATPLFFTGVGGTYEVEHSEDDGSIEVSLPPDYYSQDVRLQMFVYDNAHFSASKPAPGNLSFIGKTYDLVFVNEDGFVVTTLAQASTIIVTYDEDALGSIDEATLQPYRWGPNDGSWQAISGAALNTSNNTVTFSTTNFSSFALFGSPPAATPTPTGGGGGGFFSGGNNAVPVTVKLSGYAYPGSDVSILRDAVLVKVVEADREGRFQVILTEASGGSYVYLLYAQDEQGLRSTLTTVPLSLAPGITNQKDGIFLSPTAATDVRQVKQGEPVTVSGYSAPFSQVTVMVQGEQRTFTGSSDSNGRYAISFDTFLLPKGAHLLQAKAVLGTLESPPSRSVTFEVGDVTELNRVPSKPVGDMNGDQRVNLIDFSILAYWYKRPNPLASVDLNKDGKVDLVDVSILAFYWTG